MIYLLEELNEAEGWKQETLFQAISIADRYLKHRAQHCKTAPCLIALAVTSLMVAAKIEQHFTPSFKIMNQILADKHSLTVSKTLFLKLERKILEATQFSFSYEYPVVFLERYQQLLGVEQGELHSLGRRLCLHMLENHKYLSFKPSQIAAASLLCAIDFNQAFVDKHKECFTTAAMKTAEPASSHGLWNC